MRSTKFLIDALRNYREALDAGATPIREEANDLAEALAALQLRLSATMGDGYEALAADGVLCAESTCPGRDLHHAVGDSVCGYEMEIRPKGRSSKETRPGRW